MKQMTENNANWERLEAVIHWAKMSTNYFARYIGLPRGENLYQIRKGNNGISKDVARRVTEKFPEISDVWLLTGSGEMFKTPKQEGNLIPLYRMDAERSILHLETLNPDKLICQALVEEAQLAMLYLSEAMRPRIASGSVLFLREVTPQEIIPGHDYLLSTGEAVLLRTVRTAEGADRWRLDPSNREDYDAWEIARDSVQKVWQVCAHLTMNK